MSVTATLSVNKTTELPQDMVVIHPVKETPTSTMDPPVPPHCGAMTDLRGGRSSSNKLLPSLMLNAFHEAERLLHLAIHGPGPPTSPPLPRALTVWVKSQTAVRIGLVILEYGAKLSRGGTRGLLQTLATIRQDALFREE
ncbi:hypothetical protein CC1G_15237 [Coprinopsis cinerea okayama7|uniref:Uncharacterized protein n=1 Tax=Coprinopsis cinerea (strain Okayama-7 / 130 / ATCC MYA-4618 / FGSC 9003) TaxID=240176 RepID=D6RQ62_COPC7|nr:hypothetical protein CC1G_15237 [Coprinopsis cinerea okayama7\|eukprot:XP_002910329.1 hypothetical protein CC1G_15237 [Coprinopsis cinerea okayama7\